MYRSEIVAFTLQHVRESSVWTVRANCAAVLTRLLSIIGDHTERAEFGKCIRRVCACRIRLDMIVNTVCGAPLAGSTWTGKEQLLSVLDQLFAKSPFVF